MVPGITRDNYLAKLSIQPCPKEVHACMLLSDHRKLRRGTESKCHHKIIRPIFQTKYMYLLINARSRQEYWPQPAKGICSSLPFLGLFLWVVHCVVTLHLFLFHSDSSFVSISDSTVVLVPFLTYSSFASIF
jgi:hypothetical protein